MADTSNDLIRLVDCSPEIARLKVGGGRVPSYHSVYMAVVSGKIPTFRKDGREWRGSRDALYAAAELIWTLELRRPEPALPAHMPRRAIAARRLNLAPKGMKRRAEAAASSTASVAA